MGKLTAKKIHKEKEETHAAPGAVLMDRIIIIKSRDERPVKRDLDEDLRHADKRVCRCLNINFFRVSGIAGLNFMPTNYTELDLATLTGGLSTMVGKLVIGDEHGTGTLIAIPHGHGHKWAVLTCGHIIDSVGCDKDEDDEDRLIFELKQPGGTIVPLPIKQIKVF